MIPIDFSFESSELLDPHSAMIVDRDGDPIDPQPSYEIINDGDGFYGFYSTFPDNFFGRILILDKDSVIAASAALNPESIVPITGANIILVSILDQDNLPLENATIRFLQAGLTKERQKSDDEGTAPSYLENGTFSWIATKDNYYSQTGIIVVTIDAPLVINLEQRSYSAPSDPNFAFGNLITHYASGRLAPHTIVRFRLIGTNNLPGHGYETKLTAESDDDALLRQEFTRGFTYSGILQDGTEIEFLVPDEDNFDIPEILGQR